MNRLARRAADVMRHWLDIRHLLDSSPLSDDLVADAERTIDAMQTGAIILDAIKAIVRHRAAAAQEAWQAGTERCPRRAILGLQAEWEQVNACLCGVWVRLEQELQREGQNNGP